MVTTRAVVANEAGIHVRPSGVIHGVAKQYTGRISVAANGMVIAPDNVMGLIALGLQRGDPVEITVEGPEEERMAVRMKQLFEQRFDFPPRTG